MNVQQQDMEETNMDMVSDFFIATDVKQEGGAYVIYIVIEVDGEFHPAYSIVETDPERAEIALEYFMAGMRFLASRTLPGHLGDTLDTFFAEFDC